MGIDEKSQLRVNLEEVFFGSVAGALGKLVEYPFDTIKVRLQYQQSLKEPLFHSTWDVFVKTYSKEGFFNGFFKGISSPMMGSSLECASLFLSYKMAQDAIQSIKGTEKLSLFDKTVAGAFSGIVTSFILTPIELVKCQMQVGNISGKSNSTIKTLIEQIYRNYGLVGFWKGQGPTLIREGGGSALWFGTYEATLKMFQNHYNRSHNKNWEMVLGGALAGVAYNASFYPADTIKCAIQTSDETSALQVSRKIYKAHGIGGFYKGIGITLYKAVPANALVFFTYEYIKKTMG